MSKMRAVVYDEVFKCYRARGRPAHDSASRRCHRQSLGIADELGPGVTLLKKGDRVVMPFNVACGRCTNCEEGRTASCTLVNPGRREYLRVPFADFNALVLPAGTAHEEDFVTLADIFPTGWHGVELSGLHPDDSIAIFGAGPVGLLAVYSAVHLRVALIS
uniref:Glutathione-independent formaldehyde dehydrogenase n=1 Tax=Mycena chlorophos TaxID=658473 RepID=A0ABQ0LW10_MYCCL|nr:glutathione-independent formaldehyde dehydrogenase [Mycena chlorophos]